MLIWLECLIYRATMKIIPVPVSRKLMPTWLLKTEKILLPERMMTTSRFRRHISSCRLLSVSVSMCRAICRVSTWTCPGATIQNLQRNTREKTKKNTVVQSIPASRWRRRFMSTLLISDVQRNISLSAIPMFMCMYRGLD